MQVPALPVIEMNDDEKKETKGLTGVMTVKSGRWLPPAMGWLDRMTSPSFRSSPRAPIYSRGRDIHNKFNGGIEIILKTLFNIVED